ncbi:MAG TPA: HAD family hydrolase [Bryobacteraceae bacterium]|nr:HAD family hydrolase [Bryobacteraceae bacterium]
MIGTLFLDVGGVLGTNGWDRNMRRAAAEKFGLDLADLDMRHKQTFGTYEEGKITLDEYLERTVFCKPRDFSLDEFRAYMIQQSQPWRDMISLMMETKALNGLRVAITSNEGRELAEHRISYFGLRELGDVFIFSSFIGLRKPDLTFYRMALDISQSLPGEVLYLDDRDLFVEVAVRRVGVNGFPHKDIEETRQRLAQLGLKVAQA